MRTYTKAIIKKNNRFSIINILYKIKKTYLYNIKQNIKLMCVYIDR